jgi:hypothetical protein
MDEKIDLTQEQKQRILFLGMPDDGSQLHFHKLDDWDRVNNELMSKGVVHSAKGLDGKEGIGLTELGDMLYKELVAAGEVYNSTKKP